MTDRIEEIRERAEAYADPHQGYRTERDVRYAEDTAYLLEHIKELEEKNKRLEALASSTSIVLDHFERGTGSTTGLERVRGHLEGLGYC